MRVFLTSTGFLAIALGASLAVAGDAAAEPAGKALFVANKCNGCHSIKTQGIGVDEAAKAGAEEGEEEVGKDEKQPPDLSEVGVKGDAKFLDGFLRKQLTLNGKKHKRRFPGTKEERATLIAWLMTLKGAK